MKLLALVDHPTHVCCRYRLRAFQPALENDGHSLQYETVRRSWLTSLTQRRPRADVCVIQRRLPSPPELRSLRRRYQVMIFDFDDAVWLRDSYSPKGLESPRRLRRFRAIVEAADHVFAGNPWLADTAARFTNRDRIHIVPTCVDACDYRLAAHRDARCRLAWIGSASTLQGLARIAPTLERIGAEVPSVTLMQICDDFLNLEQLPVDRRSWSELTEADDLAAADVGIAWMPDDDWSRGKCGLKLLQYMAAGLPVVANRVGIHLDLVRDGETGFLADSADEWVAAVRTLSRDPDLRRRMGRAGRARVEREYSLERGESIWSRTLRPNAPALACA